MASLVKKKIGGHLYYYARECQRVDGRPKITWQKYLGSVETIIAAVTERRQGVPLPDPEAQGRVTELGAAAALYDLAGRLDLAGIIDRHVPKRGAGPSVGTYLLVAVLNRCVAPASKARIGAWFEGTVLRRLLEIDRRQLSSQRFWDNMERVSPPAIAAIEAELAARVVEQFGLNLERLLFDATNFFTFIDSFNEKSTLAQRGKNKEGRRSLRIVGLALLVSADFHVPLFHHTYPGNASDAPTFASLSEQLFERCQRLAQQVEHLTLIFDKGNNSRENLQAVEGSPYHFVGSLVPTQHPDLLEIPRRQFRSLAAEQLPGVWVYRTTRKIFTAPATVLVVYNENLFVAQSKTLLREIAKRQQQFRELVARLDQWQRGQIRRGRRPTLEGTRKKIRGWLKARHMKDLFEVEVQDQGGLPQVRYRFQQSAWEHLQATLLGKSLLFTDNHDWSDAEIVRAYRGQYQIEDAFRDLKDPHLIALRPQYHWTDQKIRVHVFTCVLALLLLSLLRRELHRHGIDLSLRQMVQSLAQIREMVMIFPPPKGSDEPIMRTCLTAMTSQQRRLYDALDLSRYTST